MEPERWERVKALFAAAVARDPQHRRAFLDEACPEDAELRAEVVSLLTSFAKAQSFIEPADVEPTDASTADPVSTRWLAGKLALISYCAKSPKAAWARSIWPCPLTSTIRSGWRLKLFEQR